MTRDAGVAGDDQRSAAGSGLELADLERRFGDVVALDGLSFAVRPGQLYGFVGANGAGKTTTMRIVMGIDAPDRGSVRWQGGRPGHAERARFGYMPEERGLYPRMRTAAQLAYLARLHGVSRQDADRKARSWLERLGLGERADDRLEQLSQGNQQRVQLAAALVHEPELLVLDEPFNGLDPVAVDTMSTVLVEYAHERGVPVLFSSHQLELVEALCDAVAIIDAGRLVASGGVAELRRRGRRRDNRLRVELEARNGATPDTTWAQQLPGVHVREEHVEADVHRLLLEVERPGGELRDAVLAAASRAGSVMLFEEVRPTLAELYREAISAEETTPTAPTLKPAVGATGGSPR